jgi:hypothetical protein
MNKCKGKFGGNQKVRNLCGNDSGRRCGEAAGAEMCKRPQEPATSRLVNEMATVGFANGEKDGWL